MSGASQEIEVAGKRLALSNLGKVLYPKVGFTKAQVIDYFIRIGPAVLPHLRGRPLTMKRYPDGVEGPFFFEKNCPAHKPSWVRTVGVWSEQNGRAIQYCVANDLPTLVWLANLADLELHTPLHRATSSAAKPGDDAVRPDQVVFDLDPGAPAGLAACCDVALLLRGLFAELKLRSFVKTSGSKGLQVYLPLNSRASYAETKPFARAVAETLAAQRPELVVANMKKSLRGGKVLVDWSQNDPGKTTVCAWSLRAKDFPSVSTPVSWDEVERCADERDPSLLTFDTQLALQRYRDHGDLLAPVLSVKQHLPDLGRGLKLGQGRSAPSRRRR